MATEKHTEVNLKRKISPAKKRRQIEAARRKALAKRLRQKEKNRINRLRRAKLKRQYEYQIKTARRIRQGDEKGSFLIILSENNKKKEQLGRFSWKFSAIKKYEEYIEENSKVKFPKEYVACEVKKNYRRKQRKVKGEILLVQKLPDGVEKRKAYFRDEYGKFIENEVIDANYVILDKHVWNYEETFAVYGYHPYKHRKTYDFIYNSVLLQDIKETDDLIRIFYYSNKVVFDSYEDFDFVMCKSFRLTERLYNRIQSDISKDRKLSKSVVFMGKLTRNLYSWFYDQMEQKTGWSRIKIMDSGCRRSEIN